mmetsp:Transcript_54432/g.111331  ORF Transcript_54432/g.111331 Transcript_54432/m.111331 type:complete len:171 (+) Transcript_54432:99-611(+)
MVATMASMVSSVNGCDCWEGSSDAMMWIDAIKELEKKESMLTKAAPGKMKGREKVAVPTAKSEKDVAVGSINYLDPKKTATTPGYKVTLSVALDVSCPDGFEMGMAEDFAYVKYMYAKDQTGNIVAVHRFKPMHKGNTCDFFCPSGMTSLTPYAYNNLYGLWKGEEVKLA